MNRSIPTSNIVLRVSYSNELFEELDCEDIDLEGSASIFDVRFSTSDGRQGDLPEKASGM